MRLQIYSFSMLQKRARTPFPPGTAIISIGDPELDPPKLINKPAHYLRLCFDDITLEGLRIALELPPMEEDVLESHLSQNYDTVPFTRALAKTTAEFILKHAPHTDLLICQCQYGQSRSAAVAAAVAQYFSGQGKAVFDDPRYSPNLLVYERLLDALLQR